MPGKEKEMEFKAGIMGFWVVIASLLALVVARNPVISKYPIAVVIGTAIREAITWLPFYSFLEAEPTLLPWIFIIRGGFQVIDDLLDKTFNPLDRGLFVYLSAIVGYALVVDYGLLAVVYSLIIGFAGALVLTFVGMIRRSN